MKTSTVEAWVWILMYGGLLTAAVGLFVQRGGGDALGLTLMTLGGLAAAAGAALVVLRSRMKNKD
jgi:hypothetical protein